MFHIDSFWGQSYEIIVNSLQTKRIKLERCIVLCIFFRIFAVRNPNKRKNMAKVYVFLADGFEDVEALIPIDVLRRGGVDVVTVSTTEFPLVESAHGVNIEADIQFEQSDYSDADLIMLPGGMPGASNLFEHEGVCKVVMNQFAAGKKVAAICAAPAVVLAQLGVLDGKKATCYPGFEKALEETGATYTGDLVTVDGNITTGEGPAAAFPYAYELLTQLVDKNTSDQIAEGMRFKHLMA
jgi:4-methyl-5(b-hydroxyethyl)-thiazole monophosphate biosynthesis